MSHPSNHSGWFKIHTYVHNVATCTSHTYKVIPNSVCTYIQIGKCCKFHCKVVVACGVPPQIAMHDRSMMVDGGWMEDK